MKKSREEILTFIAEIEEELSNISLLRDEIKIAARKLKKTSKNEREYIIESLALKLHNFYTACERIFEKVAGEINGRIPQSLDWHKRLLKNMALDIKGLRPPVLSSATERQLEEYLKFRHLVRSIYGFELEETKMSPLIKGIDKVTGAFLKDIERFISFLRTFLKI
ncbi:MAG: hypothetical protein HZC12_03785 [Nitrospirae bacterium]|nr:hypothetical protein [Nitrospirota bacterium]